MHRRALGRLRSGVDIGQDRGEDRNRTASEAGRRRRKRTAGMLPGQYAEGNPVRLYRHGTCIAPGAGGTMQGEAPAQAPSGRRGPAQRCLGALLGRELPKGIEDILKAAMAYIRKKDPADRRRMYIDETKPEANANKYSRAWQKGTERSRYKPFGRGTALPSGIAAPIACAGLHIEPAAEHAPERLQERTERYAGPVDIDCTRRKHGRGRCEGIQQRRSEKPAAYAKKPGGSAEKLRICGTERNGDSKTNRRARVGCGGCPYAGQCKKADRNRASRPDRELSAMRREALESTESVHGALLRMNRSTQAEGTPGVLKHDRNHKRIVRGGLASRSRSLVWLLSATTCTNAITKAPAPKPQPEEFRCIGARGLGALPVC